MMMTCIFRPRKHTISLHRATILTLIFFLDSTGLSWMLDVYNLVTDQVPKSKPGFRKYRGEIGFRDRPQMTSPSRGRGGGTVPSSPQ